ncbi:MFS transporter [Rothia aerolata]|uniref:MFS transporter n=1 Tax=Rothia aerolata TaxID=1812262 RepID=A0A917IQ70_9MICC|nr:MFS transporter [Rothia aerolata]GGH60052.1 MFS transporter [Rothia aerolata]
MSKSTTRTVVWLLSVFAYVFAVINRSSFTALGETAQHHFQAEATIVSTFVTVQLLVYALAQVPVGIFLDRMGATVVMMTGLLLMGAGQLVMGLSDSSAVAICARILVGAGDACMFVSLVRVIGDWFIPRYIPTMNQISGLMGQGGQLLAVAPLTAAVVALGWAGAFSALAALAAVFLLLMLFLMRDTPGGATVFQRLLGKKNEDDAAAASTPVETVAATPITEALPVLGPNSSGIGPALVSILKRPGIRMAFWVHMATAFSTNTFVLLWGVPFMTGGLGYSTEKAQSMVSLVIVSIMIAGLLAGPVFSRFSRRRIPIIVGVVSSNIVLWLLILLWPQVAPTWLVALSMVVLGIGGPTSMIAFDIVRTYAPYTQRGIATGLTNMGGFIGALLAVLGIGIVLDLQGAGTPDLYNLQAFKWAMAVLLPILIVALTMILIEYPRAKRYLDSKRNDQP